MSFRILKLHNIKVEFSYSDYDGMGYVRPCSLQKAFEEDAKFFVLSPPKDANGNSTRYLVLQRALASIGVCYQYHLRAVSCEAFAMTMMNAELNWKSFQLQALNQTLYAGMQMTPTKLENDAAMFREFYNSIVNRWAQLDQPIILSLEYYLNLIRTVPEFRNPLENEKTLSELNSKTPWFKAMIGDYRRFFDYVARGDIPNAELQLNKGLNINSGWDFWNDGGKLTALQMLYEQRGSDMYVWLQQNGAIEF